jgi:hypothetical protein
MALTNYGTLRAAALDWSWTSGALTDATMANDIFPIVQSQVYWGDKTAGMQEIEPLRIRSMVTTGTLTPATGGTVTISTGVSATWLEFIEMVPVYSNARSLTYMEPWSFRKQVDALASTVAPQLIYTVEGDTLYLAPKNVGTVTAAWYAKFAALGSDAATDYIITNAPQVYLYGMIAQGCLYTQDDRFAQFRAMFAGAIRALNDTDQQQRASGSRSVARPRVVI